MAESGRIKLPWLASAASFLLICLLDWVSTTAVLFPAPAKSLSFKLGFRVSSAAPFLLLVSVCSFESNSGSSRSLWVLLLSKAFCFKVFSFLKIYLLEVIIAFRKPEPYKGKGVKIAGSKILRKEGKKK